MKTLAVLLTATFLAGCSSPDAQRFFGYGPYQYCRDGDVCLQAGESWQFYPFSPGDASKYAEQGRKCWSEANRANWDQCTERF